MANKVLDWVWAHSRSRHSARLVLLSLADSTSRPGGWTWPSVPELMARTGLGERAVQLATADLAAIGELEIQYNAGPNGCHRYKVTMKTPADSAGGTQRTNPKNSSTKSSTGEADQHAVADDLADKFWLVHKSSTAQPFIGIRGIIRTAVSNGMKRNDLARALDLLAKEGTGISGASLTKAYARVTGRAAPNGQGKYAPGSRPSDPLPENYDDVEVRI